MNIQLKADGTGGELHITVNWKSLTKFFKAVIPLITVILALIYAPQMVELGTWWGLW